MDWFIENWLTVLKALGIVVGVTLTGILIQLVLFRIIRFIIRRSRKRQVLRPYLRHVRKPSRLLIISLMLFIVVPMFIVNEDVSQILQQILNIFLIISISWLLIKTLWVFEEFMVSRNQKDSSNNLKARKISTQIQLLKRVFAFTISLIAIGVILMSFQSVRQLGTSLLASAGIIGVVLGFAAQKTIGLLLAGIQIAITQPIRLDDVVIVENEWGRIEEITLTFVVVRIWDVRRMVLPINYFIDKPFQNWTRESSELVGHILIYLDYSAPISSLRAKYLELVEQDPLWDRHTANLQVTNINEKSVEIRCVMSAANAGDLWNLRCNMREKMLDHIQSHHPDKMPRLHLTMEGSANP